MNQKFPDVHKDGLKLALTVLSIACLSLLFQSCSSWWNGDGKKVASCPVTAKPSKKVRMRMPICADEKKMELWEFVGEVKQKVYPACLSGLVFLPDLPMDLIAIDAPGKVSICLWNNDRCAGWVHTSDRNYQEKKKSEIPAYGAIRLMGDEGIASIRILNNRSL